MFTLCLWLVVMVVGKVFEELADILTNRDLEAIVESSRKFRGKLTLR